MPGFRFVVSTLVASALAFAAGVASSQEYPNKAVRIVAGSAGGGGDIVARQIGQGISGPLGQPVVIENRVAILGAETVAKAPPDGYTLLIQGASLWTRSLLVKTSWDPVRDFAPVSRVTNEINILAVHPSLPARNVKELIALAKARPGELNYGSSGVGGSGHLATELFSSMAGVRLVHVPFRSGPALLALVSGDVQMLITDAALILQQAKVGKLRMLAVANGEPSIVVPGLPTIGASGLPGYEMVSTTGLFAPGKTPAAIVNRLSQEVRRVLGRPDVKERFLEIGAEVVGHSPEQFAATIKSELARLGKVVKDAGIKIE